MSAELVETSRLWARVNARIDPRWAEEAGSHVVKRTYSEPRWSRSQGAAVATERVTLYGVPLVADRTVQYARVDPVAAREIFLRQALVEGDWETHHAFWRENQAQLRRVAELEERARRRDIVVDDEVLFAFYDARIPPDVVSVRHFDRWWKGERRVRPDLLTFTEELLTSETAGEVSALEYPTTWRQGDLELDVTYQFAPGSAADGVTVHIPVALLNQVEDTGFDWQVPGVRGDLAVALLRSLPKATRRHVVRSPTRPRRPSPRRGPARGGSPTSWPGCSPSAPGCASTPATGAPRPSRTTCGSPSASRTVAASSPRARTSRRCAAAAGVPSAADWPGPAPTWSGRG